MSSARKATPKQVFLRDRAEKCQFLIQPWKLMDLDIGPVFSFVSNHSSCSESLLWRSAACCSSFSCARENDN